MWLLRFPAHSAARQRNWGGDRSRWRSDCAELFGLILVRPNAHADKQKFITPRLFRLDRCRIHSPRWSRCAEASDWPAFAGGLHLVSRGSGQLHWHDSLSAYNCIYACIFSLCRRLANLGRRACYCVRSFSWHMRRSNRSLSSEAGD